MPVDRRSQAAVVEMIAQFARLCQLQERIELLDNLAGRFGKLVLGANICLVVKVQRLPAQGLMGAACCEPGEKAILVG